MLAWKAILVNLLKSGAFDETRLDKAVEKGFITSEEKYDIQKEVQT